MQGFEPLTSVRQVLGFATALLELVLERKDSVRVLAGTVSAGRVLVDIGLVGSARAALRLVPSLLLIGDDEGRLLTYDVTRATCIRSSGTE